MPGQRFLNEAQATLKQMAQTEMIGRRAARGDTGVIALGYVFSASCSGLIPRAMRRFKEAQPDVSIQARLIETLPQFKAIIDGSLDVGVMRLPRRYPSNLTGLLIERQAFRLALPEGHRLANQKEIDPAALDGEPLIAAPLEMEPGFWGNISAVAPARLRVNIVERARRSAFTMLTLVGAGPALAWSRARCPAFKFRASSIATSPASRARPIMSRSTARTRPPRSSPNSSNRCGRISRSRARPDDQAIAALDHVRICIHGAVLVNSR